MDARKLDTRRKIQLGGLIVKAGLDEEPAAVLLGLLLEAAQKLAGPASPATRERWQAAGAAEFATTAGER
jgi:hypothetical protein